MGQSRGCKLQCTQKPGSSWQPAPTGCRPGGLEVCSPCKGASPHATGPSPIVRSNDFSRETRHTDVKSHSQCWPYLILSYFLSLAIRPNKTDVQTIFGPAAGPLKLISETVVWTSLCHLPAIMTRGKLISFSGLWFPLLEIWYFNASFPDVSNSFQVEDKGGRKEGNINGVSAMCQAWC